MFRSRGLPDFLYNKPLLSVVEHLSVIVKDWFYSTMYGRIAYMALCLLSSLWLEARKLGIFIEYMV
jgi:hypothetical protein